MGYCLWRIRLTCCIRENRCGGRDVVTYLWERKDLSYRDARVDVKASGDFRRWCLGGMCEHTGIETQRLMARR
jgi:hypothetical protein